ncbi:hypothetical protein CPB85DRAFT_1447839 [Mucidula mucida]|nr:hypothetical protein CPB85DRAFT_1447839 [Mucidula mucida]
MEAAPAKRTIDDLDEEGLNTSSKRRRCLSDSSQPRTANVEAEFPDRSFTVVGRISGGVSDDGVDDARTGPTEEEQQEADADDDVALRAEAERVEAERAEAERVEAERRRMQEQEDREDERYDEEGYYDCWPESVFKPLPPSSAHDVNPIPSFSDVSLEDTFKPVHYNEDRAYDITNIPWDDRVPYPDNARSAIYNALSRYGITWISFKLPVFSSSCASSSLLATD